MPALPPAVRAHFAGKIERLFAGRGPEAVAAALLTLPDALPEGVVVRLAGGGPFGWYVEGRLDGDVVEVIEEDRMSGPTHYRVRGDGTVEQLASEWTAMVFP